MVPARFHYPAHNWGAFSRKRQSESLGDIDCTLHILHVLVGQPVWVEHLPLQDSEGPHIRGSRECTAANTLWGHPAHRTRDIALGVVDGVVWGQLPQKTKVCHFTQFILSHYDIPCGKVLYIKFEDGGGNEQHQHITRTLVY